MILLQESNIWAPKTSNCSSGWEDAFSDRGAPKSTDPHIKVIGKAPNVAAAKEKIMAVLDTKSNRLTLKMDVSYTDHSHVIGKGGNNIKKVMQDTGCHIHFPDSNRGNQAEKSNQVSIAGQPDGVEQARRKIRELLPLTIMFELPITGALQPVPDINSPTIQQIVQTYNVSVSFKQRPRMYITTAIVRGCVNNVPALKEATARLIEHLTGTVGTTVPVSMQLEIAPQHHLFMIGRSGMNIKQLMQQTGASVHFPDPNSSPRKSTVFISGSIDSVILARDFLIGCLPLVLMFDMKEDIEVDQPRTTTLMEQLDVFISIKPKPKQPSKSVIVKSVERNAGNMYRARQILLGMDPESLLSLTSTSSTSTAPAISISDSLLSHGLGLNSLNSLGLFGGSALSVSTTPNILSVNGHISPLQSPQNSGTTSPNQWTPSSPTGPTGYPVTPIFVTQPLNTVLLAPGPTSYPTPSPPPGLTPLDSHTNHLGQLADFVKHSNPSSGDSSFYNSQSAFVRVPTPSQERGMSSNHSSSSSPSGSPSSSPTNFLLSSPMNNNDIDICTLKSGRGFVDVVLPRQSMQTTTGSSTTNSMTDHMNSVLGVNTTPPSSKKQTVTLLSGIRNIPFHTNDRRSSESGDSDCSDKRAPGAERSEREREQRQMEQQHHYMSLTTQSPFALDYEHKKLMATKAMQKRPLGSEVRTPTDMWSGLGFSRSMPEAVIREARKRNNNILPYGTGTGLDHACLPEEDTSMTNSDTHHNGTTSSCWPPDKSSKMPTSAAPGEYPARRRRPELSASSYIDGTSLPSATKGLWSTSSSTKPDLPDLFSKLGLGKYTDVFQQQEIDLQTFLTLSDQDLKELGITTFGARRKMLLAISDLTKNQQKPFIVNTSSDLNSSEHHNNATSFSGSCW
ncbi:protein bicaudal C homolog 1-like isoform X2 [Ptychodera flava]|uniref:protein bicaudal C homolog 1-like isoform X2 n=1 Tax=Ptychodera flava TaxID=63121 RepID=UPI00396A6AB9